MLPVDAMAQMSDFTTFFKYLFGRVMTLTARPSSPAIFRSSRRRDSANTSNAISDSEVVLPSAPLSTSAPSTPETTRHASPNTFNIGDRVRVIIEDVDELIRLQRGHGEWNSRMARFVGRVGVIHRRTIDGDYRVKFPGSKRRWTFNPVALMKLDSPLSAYSPQSQHQSMYPSLQDVDSMMSRETSCILNTSDLSIATLCPEETLESTSKTPEKKETTTSTERSPEATMEKLLGLESKVSAIEEAFSCGICLERLKNIVFLCGHGACDPCSRTLIECHMCRQIITKKIVIY